MATLAFLSSFSSSSDLLGDLAFFLSSLLALRLFSFLVSLKFFAPRIPLFP